MFLKPRIAVIECDQPCVWQFCSVVLEAALSCRIGALETSISIIYIGIQGCFLVI